ncbi:ROK family protein [Vibrio mediterranei]
MLIGLDIGGTKVETIALDIDTHKEVNRVRIATPPNYSEFVATVKQSITDVSEGKKITSIGIGCCGSLDQNGLMQGANLTFLNGTNFIDTISECYAVKVHFSNDANCFALSEFHDGAATDSMSSCIAIIIGTGCGSGIVINGQLLTGTTNIGGEIGHNPLPHYNAINDGKPAQCFCGSMNCNELFVSGSGFQRTFADKHEALDSKQIMTLFRKGDKRAIEHFETYCDQLARVIGSVVNVIDPEVVVLGGGMSNVDEIYPRVNELVDKYTITKTTQVKVVKNVHGDSSGVRGAALLHLFTPSQSEQ